MAHIVKLNAGAIAAMSSVVLLYVAIKSPLKNQYLEQNRLSPKADLAWRNSAQKWLDSKQ